MGFIYRQNISYGKLKLIKETKKDLPKKVKNKSLKKKRKRKKLEKNKKVKKNKFFRKKYHQKLGRLN